MNFTARLNEMFGWFGGITAFLLIVGAVTKWVAERWLERRFESHKAELVRLTEQLKHGLEREMLKAQLSTNKAHEVYPVLYEKILRAHGVVAGLIGGRFALTYEDFDTKDFNQLLRRTRLPHGERDRLLKAIAADRESGIQELQRVLRQVEIRTARVRVMRAKNYRILKALYLSPAVQALALEIVTAVNNCWVDIDVGFKGVTATPSSVIKALEEIRNKLDQLEQLMRKELQPSELKPALGSG